MAATGSAVSPAAAQEPSDADLQRASGTRTVAIGSPGNGRVTTLPLEIYVARVLAGEAEPSAADAAFQALAVAVRTYAIFNLRRHAKDGFDLCDTTHCQVLRAATPATRRAALATAGQILTYHGKVAEIFYSASCGGRSEAASEVWPGMKLPYLRSLPDDVHDGDDPWTLELTLGDIQRRLSRQGFSGRLREVRITDRNASGRAARIELKGLTPDTIRGDQFRLAIGPAELKSTAFAVKERGGLLTFVGRGYGHGVGLCTIGAGRRARRGESAAEILGHYYPGTEIENVATR